jgi:hypothetical protein
MTAISKKRFREFYGERGLGEDRHTAKIKESEMLQRAGLLSKSDVAKIRQIHEPQIPQCERNRGKGKRR